MQKLALSGMAMWSVWQPDRAMFFNSFFLERAGGNIVVDPLALSDVQTAYLRERGGVAWIVITNRDHERRARELATAFSAKIATGEKEAKLLSGPADRQLKTGDTLADDLEVIELEGGKTPGEIALHLKGAKAAIVGDALWGDPAGSLRLPPDEKLIDPKKAVLSLRQIWALRLDVLLVGDGACLFGNADAIIGACLQARADVYVNRINVDELYPTERFSEGGGRYEGLYEEIGNLIGARVLGYQITTLPPGKRFCPLHIEDMDEEMFIIWEGEAVIRTLRGEYTCRKGDIIAFPVGDIGAHQVINKSDKPCRVFMLGAEDPKGVCYYPDSKKVLVSSRGRLIIRTEPALDYYDGET
ncbi:MAG: cupin domain-containing protein [Candidatus Eremiobacteraeota bacterium]|nr:cupin domain-containing protein [Candidatus Eremiobacteraeota bacterium]